MPDQRLSRARATLPSGYQFGDAAETGLTGEEVARLLLCDFRPTDPDLIAAMARNDRRLMATPEYRAAIRRGAQTLAEWVDQRALEEAMKIYGFREKEAR